MSGASAVSSSTPRIPRAMPGRPGQAWPRAVRAAVAVPVAMAGKTLRGWESPPRDHAGNGSAPPYAKSHAQCPEKLRRAWITTARYQHGFPTTRASAKHSAKAIHGHPESRLVVAERPLLQSRVGLPRMILAVTLLEDASETCGNDNNIQFAGPWHQI